MMLNDSWHDQQQLQMEDDAPQLVSLEFVKVALSEVLENFQFNRQQDGIGSLCQFVECTLRQLGHNDFVQAKSQILQVLASFDTESCSTSMQHTSSVNKSSNGETGLLAKNTKGPRLGDTPFDGMMTARDPERVIFNSKSSKSPVLPLTNQGSEFYQKFVSSVLKPTSQQAQAEGNSSNAQDGSNTPTQPLVSSTKLESESPRAGLAGSNSKSKTIFPMSTSSPSKPTHVLSPSSTSSPPVAHSAVTSKASAVDLGFHRLRSQILVDSLHVRRKPDSATSSPSTSLLQHAWKKRPSGDKSEGDLDLGESGTNSPSSLSPLHYSGEALKVLAKNLRVTIINRQAKGVEESSSGDDSSSDDDSDEEDSSDANKETEEATDNPEKTPL